MPKGPNVRSWFSKAGTGWGEVIGRHGSNGAAVCGVQVSVPASSSLDWQDRGPEGQLEAEWAAGRDSRTHPPLGFSPSFRGFLFWARGSGLPLTREAERLQDLCRQPPSFSLDWTGELRAVLPGTQEVCAGCRATSLAILVTAWPLPDPDLPQDQPQRLERWPGPPFPAWGNKSAQ